MKCRIFIFALFLIVWIGSIQRTLACTLNANLPPICEMYGKARGIFVGKIVNSEVTTNAQGRFTQSGFEGRKYRVWAFGKKDFNFGKEEYGASSAFVLNEKTASYNIILDKTESWLTEMDDDNEKEIENKRQP